MTPDAVADESLELVVPGLPELALGSEHHLCPGCGEPLVLRVLLDALAELEVADRTIGVFGIGCYTGLAPLVDVDVVQALHGRAPDVATGIKRVRPEAIVFTLQGDGDMVNEGLQDLLHTAARGELVTCVMLNNGVFGETGGHMTATTVLGQRTKTSLDGRDVARHGHPIRTADIVASMDGVGYAARGSVHNPAAVRRTAGMLRRALECQRAGAGFSLVEVVTMCPTGWFLPTADAPAYLEQTMAATHSFGELRAWDAGPAGS
jgi:2-oxoglutarate ferredoxin oxidoreductase subunit beta